VVVAPRLDALLDRIGPVDAVAVDMILWLPATGRRACDDAARARLGARRSSVFAAPLACCLGAPTHAEAVVRARAAGGPAPSIQAFNLLPKIEEAMAAATTWDLHEASPELSFAVLAGAPLVHSKRTAAGAAERLALLETQFPDAADRLAARPRGPALDDVLDAYAAAWTARRIARGDADRLGDAGEGAVWV
jgi:predicted RNase H-like nuclease